MLYLLLLSFVVNRSISKANIHPEHKNTTQNKHTKTTAWFGPPLVRPPAWKRRSSWGPHTSLDSAMSVILYSLGEQPTQNVGMASRMVSGNCPLTTSSVEIMELLEQASDSVIGLAAATD